MTTTPTANPIPSEDPRDLKFNAGKIDEFVTSQGWTYTDRFGIKRYTIEGMNYLARQSLAAFGYITIESFQLGATLTLPNQVLHDTSTGEYYRWDGVFPKVVAANSTPASSGGVGTGKWLSVGDATLRSDLAKTTGAGLVNTTGGKTVQGAFNQINAKIIYAEDYGVKADGATNDTDALINLSLAINAMNYAVKVIFPKGVSIVGRQKQSGQTGLGYSFEPAYRINNIAGYFSIEGRSEETIIDADGYSIRMAPAIKIGSYDPVTGLPMPTAQKSNDYKADPGVILSVKHNLKSVFITGLDVDGNAANLAWGGKFGDDGWQNVAYGLLLVENKNVILNKCLFHDHGADGVYSGTDSASWIPPLTNKLFVSFEDCLIYNNRRQGVSYCGGQNLNFTRTQIFNIGKFAKNSGTYFSSPGALIDIENEAGNTFNLYCDNCEFYGAQYALLALSVSNDSDGARFNNCRFKINSTHTAIYSKITGLSFEDCDFKGSGFELAAARADGMQPMFSNCRFANHFDGIPVSASRYIGQVGNMENCLYHLLMAAGSTKDPIFVLTAARPASAGPVNGSTFNGNSLLLFGDTTNAVSVSNGRVALGEINNFNAMDLMMYDYTSGSKLMQIKTSSSWVNVRGVVSTTNRIVDADTGSIATAQFGQYVILRDVFVYAQNIIPCKAGGALGSDSNRLGSVFANALYMQSPNGDKYQVIINNAGSITVTKL